MTHAGHYPQKTRVFQLIFRYHRKVFVFGSKWEKLRAGIRIVSPVVFNKKKLTRKLKFYRIWLF